MGVGEARTVWRLVFALYRPNEAAMAGWKDTRDGSWLQHTSRSLVYFGRLKLLQQGWCSASVATQPSSSPDLLGQRFGLR